MDHQFHLNSSSFENVDTKKHNQHVLQNQETDLKYKILENINSSYTTKESNFHRKFLTKLTE